ncbi:DUF6273 domain-containing protein [Pseudobutyrivibrio xylanivorans]|uniref:Uncharacterized protein n=1 Tax=Pseudobutyrivibrio xylanivorans TaxID=185007 RepID=A0A5P6VPL7_PSEXY|nr:DUF6273 domain-containing protein [Pseudobutyrivibrio xylanivorans]QFJ54400.1 hypothetical protein FXF36_05780 [Pseudobutyrivibrio xylanivorans]
MKKRFRVGRKIMVVVLAAVLCLPVILNPMEAEAAKKKGNSGAATYAVGDDVAFGFFDGTILSWTILTYDDTTKQALVVSRKPLNSRSVTAYRLAIDQMYRDKKTEAGYVRWSENYWRGWLNKTFYETCFNDAERAMILRTTLSETDAKNSIMNYYHDTSMDAYVVQGNKKNSLNMAIYNSQTTTKDYIFFLSSDEYTAHKDTMKNETKLIFPLRTNAYDDPTQGLFGNDTDKLIYRMYYYAGDSIRPAMNIQLGEPEATTDDSSSTTKSTTNSANSKISTSDTSKSTTNTASTSNTKATATATSATTSTATASTASNSKKYANNGTNTGDLTLPDDSEYTTSVGATAQVAIDLEYLNSTEKNYTITYKSSDASVFTVDSSGVITAVGKGSGTITARMKKSNGKTYTMSCRVDVN